ncbi:MAG: hypothetical protein Fur0015_02660 [Ignavibacteriales bacterium]
MHLMKTIFFLAVTLFSLDLLAANALSYIIVLENNPQNNLIINEQNLPILYQGRNSLIVIAEEASINILESNEINFQKVEKYFDSDKFYLITKKRELDNIHYSQISGVLYSDNDFAILKNINPEEIIKLGFKPALLKITKKIFSTVKSILPKQSSTKLDSLIFNTISKINSDSVKYFIQKLQNFGTRFMLANNRKDVAVWIKNQFKRFGFENARLDSFFVLNTWQFNVIAQLNSEKASSTNYVVGAHHDCISQNNPMVFTPGADDNASGAAAVLEIARVLKETKFSPEVNIIFTTFAGEEYGLYGSEDFAQKAAQQNMEIALMINHDMIATSSKQISNSTVTINHYSGSEDFTELALNNIEKYTNLNSQKGDLNASYSDSYSFWTSGFKTIYFEETEFSSHYHTDKDIIDYCNIPYCTEVIKSSCAVLINSMSLPTSVRNVNILDAQNGTAARITWERKSENDFSHYKIYVGSSSGNYDKTFVTTSNEFTINNLVPGNKYFIGASVIDLDGNESIIVENIFSPVNFTFDKGILVVDETADGNGSIGKPIDESVDDFYKKVLGKFNRTDFDIIDRGGISVADFANYSTIIWHGDDYVNLSAPLSVQNDLKRFLLAGGKFIYSGYTPSKAFVGNYKYPTNFEKGNFLYDVLKINRAEKKTGSKFSGAISTLPVFPQLFVDTNKIPADYNYHLSNIESIYPTIDANAIFLFDTKYDTTTVMGSMYRKPVGIEYLGNDYKLVILSFPLYFMNESGVEVLLSNILAEHFDEATDVEETTIAVPTKFSLKQNYPNPFNPYTTIEFTIPNEGRAIQTELKIFDALGREIALLVDEQKPAGSYKVVFDGSNLASGFYYYRLKSGDFVQIKKMVLIK